MVLRHMQLLAKGCSEAVVEGPADWLDHLLMCNAQPIPNLIIT